MQTATRKPSEIKLGADLALVPVSMWINLGACQALCRCLAAAPLNPERAITLEMLSISKGIAASFALDGIAVSEEWVYDSLTGRAKEATPQLPTISGLRETIEECLRIRKLGIEAGQPALTRERISRLHETLNPKIAGESDGLTEERPLDQADRRKSTLVDSLCEWLSSDEFAPVPGMEIVGGVIRALLAHFYLETIRPFPEGNGRTSRMVELMILTSSGIPTSAAHLLSVHYLADESEYRLRLEQGAASGGQSTPFVVYAVKGFLSLLEEYLTRIRDMQTEEVWRNYANELFESSSDGESEGRIRNLLLDLSDSESPVPFSKLRRLSTRTAAVYARRSSRTLARDIRDLCRLGLVERLRSGYRVRKDKVNGFRRNGE